MQEFGVELGAEERAQQAALAEDYEALHDAQWASESAREARCEAFREPLLASAADALASVRDVQLVVQHEMLLDPGTHADEALVRIRSPCPSARWRVRCEP
jgi:hypothetical protein